MDPDTFKLPEETFMPVSLDPAMVALKYECIEYLQDKGFIYFEDFSEVESDMGNGELKIFISCDPEKITPAIREFAKANRFKRGWFIEDRGCFKLCDRTPE